MQGKGLSFMLFFYKQYINKKFLHWGHFDTKPTLSLVQGVNGRVIFQ